MTDVLGYINQQKSLTTVLQQKQQQIKDAVSAGDSAAVAQYKQELSDTTKQYTQVSNKVAAYKEAEVFSPASLPVTPSSYTDSNELSKPYDTGGYNVESHQYPNDLLTNPAYGGNYAIFYINVAVDSKLAQAAAPDTFVKDFDQTTRLRGSVVASNLSVTQVGAAATLSGSATAGGITSILNGGGLPDLKAVAKVGGANAVGYTAVGSIAASGTRAQKRLTTAIALHVPNQLMVRYGVVYGEEDTIGFAASAEMVKALSDLKVSAAGNVLKYGGANLALSQGAQSGAVSAATGLAPNPKKEQIFKGVDFRTFTFEYQFFPRSPEEAQNVKNIIDKFKYHMHPEYKGPGEFLFIYPSEFDIVYYAEGKENQNVHKHTSCVLENMTVNYTPNGMFNTFTETDKLGNGMPTQINVTLNFKELQILNKDLVDKGL